MIDTSSPTQTEEPALPAPADAAMIAELRRKARNCRRISRVGDLLAWLGILVVNSWFMWGTHYPESAIIVTVVAGILIGGTGKFIEGSARNNRNKAIEELISDAGVSIIGPLLDDLDMMLTLDAVQSALITLLPCLQASDAPLLLPRHHRILNRIMNHRRLVRNVPHRDLLLAILKASEQVGGTEDVPAVERLAAGEGYAKKDKRIQEAAKECLPYLQARSEQQESRQTLLRASGVTAESGESLLRPAQAVDPTEPRQLLRAANSETLE